MVDVNKAELLYLTNVNNLSTQLLPTNFDMQLEQVVRRDRVEQKKCTDQERKD